MAAVELTTGSSLYSQGQPLTMLHFINKGSVMASFPGGSITLEKGDVIGIVELCTNSHFLTYEAIENSSIITYAYKDETDLQKLFAANKEFANVFVNSACKQLSALLKLYNTTREQCNVYYQDCVEDFQVYKSISSIYRMSARALPELDELDMLSLEEELPGWFVPFYDSLRKTFSGCMTDYMDEDTWLPTGFLYQISSSFYKVIKLFEDLEDYIEQIAHIYFNDSYVDMFELYATLSQKIGKGSPDYPVLDSALKRIINFLCSHSHTDQNLLQSRYSDLKEKLSVAASKDKPSLSFINEPTIAELRDSLSTLLSYAGVDTEKKNTIHQLIAKYKMLADRNSADDHARLLRNKISIEFYDLYEIIAKRALEDKEVPPIVDMFLYFGYMDEDIAGIDNACQLYELVKTIYSHHSSGVYPFFHWLKAIYTGHKEPSRNEFDEDYTRYVHNLRSSNKITDQQVSEYLMNPWFKVQYEIRNMFIPVNKMTFGRMSTFCPIFSEHNVLKELDRAFVSTHRVGDSFATICAVDYSAFYRETLFSSEAAKIPREYIHTEVLPDVILMPNMGFRGVMWQEIEGKRRTTPSRMMISIFQLEDLLSTFIRLTGEFRWEMCKRVQGPRWNDISERSLTSEYCDYIQFYRKNIDLSVDAKEKVHASLQKARNSFKEMFVRDYIVYMQYEASGSPRLNKVSRNILFQYCTFSKTIRDKLKTSPQYKELLEKNAIKSHQKIHRIEGLIQKQEHNHLPVPEEIQAELEFLKG